tara:strand:+ start:20515 stop:20754 length:240 start_codon:yes stop_codon:yes gene_type:complete
MLLRKLPSLVTRKVAIRLPGESWHRYDKLVSDAALAGHQTQLEEALSQALIRMLGRAERELRATDVSHAHKTPDQTDFG